MIIAVMICRLILNLRSDRSLENVDEMSEFQCATRKGGKAKIESGAGSPTIFDSQPGTIGSMVADYEWEMEFASASVVEGKPDSYGDRGSVA